MSREPANGGGEAVDVCFLDFSKAFDIINRHVVYAMLEYLVVCQFRLLFADDTKIEAKYRTQREREDIPADLLGRTEWYAPKRVKKPALPHEAKICGFDLDILGNHH